MPTVLKSVSLNLLERSGTVQVCIGTALPLPDLGTVSEGQIAGQPLVIVCQVMTDRSAFVGRNGKIKYL
jgi:hypothetical protein